MGNSGIGSCNHEFFLTQPRIWRWRENFEEGRDKTWTRFMLDDPIGYYWQQVTGASRETSCDDGSECSLETYRLGLGRSCMLSVLVFQSLQIVLKLVRPIMLVSDFQLQNECFIRDSQQKVVVDACILLHQAMLHVSVSNISSLSHT